MPYQDKTEEATPRRRAEARQKGQVARSVELSSAIVLLVGFLCLSLFGGRLCGQLTDLLRETIRLMALVTPHTVQMAPAEQGLPLRFVTMMLPIFLGLLVLGVAGNLAQTNMLLALHPLKPDISRINPLRGLSRFFSLRIIVELAKSVAKVGIAAYVAYSILEAKFPELLLLSQGGLGNGARLIAGAVLEIGLKAGGLLLVLAAGDYVYQRYQFQKNLKMTRQEVKEEMRHYEGAPELKARIRRMQRALARGRMMQNVPQASVVVTNPVHLAVALQYDAAAMKAPKVIAKGQRLIAEEIKRIAQAHSIPIVENRPLARALWELVDIGQEIPDVLYKAVAEVLAFVYRLKNQVIGEQRR
ncbi:MAG: flagellar biosynthesis protein FlhB [Chloroflexota bacterium]